MRVALRVGLLVGLVALALPRLGQAAPAPLIHHALASPTAVNEGSGSGAGAGLSPWLVGAASIVPGFGQLVNGDELKAAGFFASAVVFYIVGGVLLAKGAITKGSRGGFIFDGTLVFASGVGVTFWSMWDAFHVAKAQSSGLAPVPTAGGPATLVTSGEAEVERSLSSGLRLPLVALRF